MLADSLAEAGYPARHVMGELLGRHTWTCTVDEMFQNDRNRQQLVPGAFCSEDVGITGGNGGVEGINKHRASFVFFGLGAGRVAQSAQGD